ncbi:Outer membrane lipoprotein-sorting protein [Cruoricaptor ignavus]|uniref:Outer membrane lipoprotein-sorting protein n=1 Tax=Cruoricaptor ignavus TaxID=1118202 RepID=A0A1M6GV51_9FLAO|nr:histidine kinase [Cruoricaptor ignavus]SHJ13836.1 Outer membrane lipoprotein-sorting protein [Cruoricaptor ignavus]
MKHFFTLILFFLSALGTAQTAQEIISKNIELTGGRQNWKSLNSILLQGRAILGLKEECPVKIYQQRPNLTKTIITLQGKDVAIEGYDGKKGYAMNYAANKIQEYPGYKAESFDSDFLDWKLKGYEIKYLGKEKLGNKICHKIELSKNRERAVYYFDAATHLLVQEQKGDETLRYSDFRKVKSYTMPFRIESESEKNEGNYVLIINKIEINKEFPANTFKF